jgi:hypothetical protein
MSVWGNESDMGRRRLAIGGQIAEDGRLFMSDRQRKTQRPVGASCAGTDPPSSGAWVALQRRRAGAVL